MIKETFLHRVFESHQACKNCPTPRDVSAFFDDLLGLLFPNFASAGLDSEAMVAEKYRELQARFASLLPENYRETVAIFFESIPEIYDQLLADVDAIYHGDPAATSPEEVIRSYPGFYAISAYRLANRMERLGIPNIPRSITEHAHSMTGIDIHPGATIGSRFCIDHGTGVVIGETTVIGEDVKVYQGVTLGALSVDKALANTKRHPTIGNRVILYAGATVLGGNTHVGDDSVVGGNVWLTKSIPSNSRVYYRSNLEQEVNEMDKIVAK